MAQNRKKITKKNNVSLETKRQRLKLNMEEWKHPEWDTQYCFSGFMVSQYERGNSKATLDFYRRFYKKYTAYIMDCLNTTPKELPIEHLTSGVAQSAFIHYLETLNINQQTINSYLRGFRAFGNFCEEEGYIDGFKCPIKEVEPPIKEVYSDEELQRLLKKPDISDFVEFRSYCIISLILNTAARSNTILNIKICDLELEEGYINFNTTKAHKIVRLGLERKTKRDLEEWVNYWRIGKGASQSDYLFCNEYGEQLSRSALAKSIAKYNNSRGVEKTSIHLFRHTYAKKWITSGGDIISLARVLTHSELEMVKRYSNLYGSDVKKEIEEHSAISQLKVVNGKTLKNQKRKLSDI